MKFGTSEIPQRLFDLARARMLEMTQFTPEDIRQHLIQTAGDDLVVISTIKSNWWIIANRVMRSCVESLAAAGEVTQVKRGVWAKVPAAC